MEPLRVAVVQAAPVVFDVPRTLDKLWVLTADAGRRGARLVVFPEAFVSAYPKGLGFGARLGSALPKVVRSSAVTSTAPSTSLGR